MTFIHVEEYQKSIKYLQKYQKKIIAQVALNPLLELIKGGSTWILEPKLGTITNNGRSIKRVPIKLISLKQNCFTGM